MRKLHFLSLSLLFMAACALGTEVGPNQGFSRKVSFDNYDQGVSYSITATPQAGWHFIDEDTKTHNNWNLGTHSSSAANANVSVDGSLGSPDFFGLALDGYMVPDTEGKGQGEKKYWSITADVFYIHSDEEYSELV